MPVFTGTRVVLNTSYRMVYPFLSIFGRGLGVDVPSMALAVTIRSLSGVAAPFIAAIADSRGRKLGMLLGMGLFIVGTGIVIFWPTYPVFVLTLVLTLMGKYAFDTAMQAYLGDRVAYQRRGRVLAITEYGWSLSLIIGVPVAGFLIARRGWVAPFTLLVLLGLLAFLLLAWMLPKDPQPESKNPVVWSNLRSIFTFVPAILALTYGLLMSTANETVNLVFGVWMEDAFNLKIAALGAATAVIGFSELGGESLSVWLTDRLGKTSAIRVGLGLNCLAALALPFLGISLPGALVGLFLFYSSFEFTIVSSIPMLTEIMPSARATLLAVNVATFSLGRALGALLATQLYAWGKAHPSLPFLLANALAAIVINLFAFCAIYLLRKYIR